VRQEVTRPEDRESFSLGGIEARVLVAGEDTGRSFAIVEAPIVPKALAGPLHTHHREDALWYVIEGEFGAQVGDRHFAESSGAVIFAPRGIPHTYWNPGSTAARYLEICWPAGLEIYLENVGRAVRAGGEELLSRVAGLSDEYGIEMHWESIEGLAERYGVGFAM
jgi:mannose-6-phosphate isomerase-like protein (cupin superfamily)